VIGWDVTVAGVAVSNRSRVFPDSATAGSAPAGADASASMTTTKALEIASFMPVTVRTANAGAYRP
jgi:hypothetical protein